MLAQAASHLRQVHGAGVPVQLWADRSREDTHHAGQQGSGRAGHHTQGHPQGEFLFRSYVVIMTIHSNVLSDQNHMTV